MTDPYVSFDTFSLGDGPNEPTPAAPQRPSLLARLPRVAPTPSRSKPIQRFDDAESPLRGVHLGEAGVDLAMAGFPTGASPVERRVSPVNPAATIRIDTVSPTTFDDAEPTERRRPAPAPVAITQPTTSVAVDDPWAAWLLNLESTIIPYSRVIVLAAVIAAMGLTVVLLRGGPKATTAPNSAPQVSTEADGDSLVTTDVFAKPTTASFGYWPTPATPQPEGDLRPISPTAVAATGMAFHNATSPMASAAGPASAWRGPAGAKLSGQVLPVDDSRVNVAEAPAPLPTKTR